MMPQAIIAARGEDPRTWANAVTVVRGVGGLTLFALARARNSEAWNFAGLLFFWVLDVADGYLARRLRQETRLGAQMDILADRLLVVFFYLNYLDHHPDALVPVVLFLFQFMGIDHYLSNQFLRWPILSPNYFHQIDRMVWAANWSLSGKLLNSFVITALLVLTGSAWLTSSVALAIITLKIHSAVRIHRLPAPEAAWAPPRLGG